MTVKPFLTLFLVLLAATVMAQKPVSTMVHFPVNGDEIESEASSKLRNALLNLDIPYRCYLVTISGHTDADGDQAFNAALSKRRAESVRTWLKKEGMPEDAITMAGEGELRPLASNESESGKARNRRVELKITPNPAGCPKPFDFDVSFFEIDLDANQAVNFTYKPSGTKVYIPGNSLVDINGNKVSGMVTFRYREWRNPVEFLVSNITMDYPRRFSGQHFQSGGMFELRAYKDGVEVKMGPGHSAKINFVLTDSSPAYDLYSFNGNRDQWHAPNYNPFARTGGGRLNTDETDDSPSGPCVEEVVFGEGVDTVQTFISLLDTALYYLDQPRVNRTIEFTRLPNFERCWSNRGYAGVDYIGDLNESEQLEYQGISITAVPVKRSRKWARLRIHDEIGNNSELKAVRHVEFYALQKSLKKLPAILNKTFSDFRITPRGRKAATLVCKEPTRFHKIGVIVRDKRRNRPDRKVRFWKTYKAELKKRRDEYQRTRITRLPQVFWNYSKVIMVPEERCLSKSRWLNLFSRDRKMMKERYGMTKQVVRDNPELAAQMIATYLDSLQYRLDQGKSIAPRPPGIIKFYQDTLVNSFVADLSISGFGVWNCDQIARLKDPITFRPVYLDVKGEKIAMSTLSVIDESINGVLCFGAYSNSQIAFGGNSSAVFVGVAQDGKRYYMGSEDVAKLVPDNKNSADVILHEIPEDVKSVSDLSLLLGLSGSQQIGMR